MDLSMRIAFVVPYVPNLIRTRSYNLINQLTSLGHEVTVFTLGSSEGDLIDAQRLKGQGREVYYYNQPVWRSLLNSVAALPSGKPLQSVYSWQQAMARQIVQHKHQGDDAHPYKEEYFHQHSDGPKCLLACVPQPIKSQYGIDQNQSQDIVIMNCGPVDLWSVRHPPGGDLSTTAFEIVGEAKVKGEDERKTKR